MPLIRKPTARPALKATEADGILKALADPDPDRRWAAARGAAALVGGGAALAAALPTEEDPRVREAMFTGLARIGTAETAAAAISLLRSDDANLRTGALDTLRLMVSQMHDLLPRLLKDQDVDVRILSCELARSLPSPEATSLMCGVLDDETEANVCAAAVDVLAEVGGAEALPSLRACVRKFRDTPFLAFAIKAVVDRLAA
ncbi:MAG TPA: HEAT repeat domain-containing protein [Steroidobacteraceae bacterium]|jgi:HEAT repeat protein|nr:HEAT repeat domain-containing protein [Steroidobacteraceae bacterium]